MRIVQILDYPGLNRTAFTVAVAECAYSAAISINFVAIWRPPSRFANDKPSQSPFQHPHSRFRPVYQTDLLLCPAQNSLGSDGGMAVVPLFDHSSTIPVSLVFTTETYVNKPARGGYFNCLTNSHGSAYPYDPGCLCTRWDRPSNTSPILVGRCHAALPC